MTSTASNDPQLPAEKRPISHLELLVGLIGMFVIESFLSHESFFQRAIFNILFLCLVFSAIRTLSGSRTRLTTAMVLGVGAFVCSWATEWYSSIGLVAAVYCCYIVVFSLLIAALVESVFRDGPVDSNRIIGAVSIFLVLGFAWAFVYALLETLAPGAFRITTSGQAVGIRQHLLAEFLYFSNVTLTTLGYGDIVPLSRPARTLASLQAIVGQLYLTVVVARLVGLHISQKR